MEQGKLCDSDYRFMRIVWEHAPVGSGELVKLCEKELGWKKSTTYTVIKKLCEKGYIANEHAMVKALVSREKVQQQESDYFVRRTFGGSLPGFLTAFLGNRRLSEDEARELEELIARHKEGS
ncbi:MAG TPA: BlaI/MecI/CopY family transcriptional regulator [Candidatus Blautia gallistercoris]|uniref:BlaI/MecI/CopY family transcriptional regulator n=1 Tax=Candidatus Blautia gallistercoris TaxID=2838490 RepID=A0A9D1WFU7_9FIRM|nr:BlaI/MecI/CopY family transcriptional regulator [Candidatus Blautia gallistercoris]